MGKTASRPPRDLRAALLRSATRMIAERGFGAVSLQDIAEDVGVSKQALLYHFKSKETLKEAVIQNQLARTNAEFMAILSNVNGKDIHELDKGIEPWLEMVEVEVRRGQKQGHLRPELNAGTALQQIGMLALTNFALMQLGDWSPKTDRTWKKRRLAEFVRTIGFILFPDEARKRARKTRTKKR